MKVTKEKAAENRAEIVKAASRLFRQRGFDGVGVAEITKAAGLTHGGFYGQFASKEALAEEASRHAFAEGYARMNGVDDAADLDGYIDRYISVSHRDRRATGCPLPTLATEVDRQAEALQSLFTERVEMFVDKIAARLPPGDADEGAPDESGRRARAMTLASAMVGSLVLARATAAKDPDFSAALLASVREEMRRFVGKSSGMRGPVQVY